MQSSQARMRVVHVSIELPGSWSQVVYWACSRLGPATLFPHVEKPGK
jgi:hypothetical protein